MTEDDQQRVPELPDITRTEIVEAEVRKFDSEADFMELSVSLLVEAGSYVCVAGNLYPGKEMAWDKNHAIFGGHLIRLFKLVDGLLDQTVKLRRETSFVLGRLAFECIVNLRYLIAYASEELFDSYRSYSLRHERRLLGLIRMNIEDRGGEVLAIEQRMINSIERSFRVSGISLDAAATPAERNWGGKNLFERAKGVGLESAYLAAFGGASHSVHGNWQDLLEYHLEDVDGKTFRGDFEWHRPRPQLLDAITLHSAEAVIDYLEYVSPDEASPLFDRLKELHNRVLALSRLHEEFLARE